MIAYLLQMTLCWMILFAGYYLFLKKETFFLYNRWYLLAALILGMMIPLVDWSALFLHQPDSLGHIYISPVQSQVQQLEIYVSAAEDRSLWPYWLLAIYIIGLLVSGTRMIKGLADIRSLHRGAKKVLPMEGYNLVLTRKIHMPFSFLKSVYWSEELYRQTDEKDKILAHEVQHVSALHSLDVLFLEMLCIIFWFHPLPYLYRKELRKVHEYEADAAACILGNKKEYGKILLSQAQSGLHLALANHFFYSQLKDRIIMMTRKPSHRYARYKYLMVLPIIGLIALLFSFSATENLPDNPLSEFFSSDTIPLKTIGISPEETAGKELMEHIAEKIKYPAEARSAEIQGTVTVSYSTDESGAIRQVEILDNPGAGLGEEVARVLKSSPSLIEKPAGQYDLSVEFILQGEEIQKTAQSTTPDFTVVGYAIPPSESSGEKDEINTSNVRQTTNTNVRGKVIGIKIPDRNTTDSVAINFLQEEKSITSFGKDGKNSVIIVNKNSSPLQNSLVVIDGVVMEGSEGHNVLKDLTPERIHSISVLKDQPAVEKYGEAGRNGVIEVIVKKEDGIKSQDPDTNKTTTIVRKNQIKISSQNVINGDPVIILDGEVMGQGKESLINTISPSTIESITILKSQNAIEKYGETGQNGVIEITSKVPQTILEKPELKLSSFRIYPNPVQHELNIELEGPEGDYRLEIMDISGASLKLKTLYNQGVTRTDINTGDLNAGMYYLIITSGNSAITRPFVKQ